jgi:hypothetical protein
VSAGERPAAGSGLPLMYVYDSYNVPVSDWRTVLGVGTSNASIRGTKYDALMLCLVVERGHRCVCV